MKSLFDKNLNVPKKKFTCLFGINVKEKGYRCTKKRLSSLSDPRIRLGGYLTFFPIKFYKTIILIM